MRMQGGTVKVTINQSLNVWVLCISFGDRVIRAYTRKRLIDVLDVACKLQLHVDNANELPLNQYLNGEKYYA